MPFRKKVCSEIETLQNDPDEYIEEYNTERAHQGKRCKGRTSKSSVLKHKISKYHYLRKQYPNIESLRTRYKETAREKKIKKISDPFLFNTIQKNQISPDRLRFFRDIFTLQHQIKNKLHDSPIPLDISDKLIKDNIRQGRPLISSDNLQLDGQLLAELLQDLLMTMQHHDRSSGKEAAKIRAAYKNGDIEAALLVRALLSQDSSYFESLAKAVGAQRHLLIFLALNLAKPFLEHLAARYIDPIDDSLWLKKSCPICGSPAHIARLDKEDGKRMLYCQLCGGKWRFGRIRCAFCCTADRKNLKIIEENEGHCRIDLCDQCGRYIKTLVEKNTAKLSGIHTRS